MLSQPLVENKKKLLILSIFVGLFLSVGLANAEIKEINTTCSLWNCESYLLVEDCTGQPLDKVEKKFEKTADIKSIDAKAVKGSDNLLYVFGSIEGATQNKWSISIGSCILDPWWNSSFPYKRNVTINNTQNSNALINYQVPINVTNNTNFQSDWDDLRFIDDDDSTELDYWIESKSNGDWAYAWVEIPSIPASDTKDIIMYYGNPEVFTTSNADATFDVYSNFTCVSDPCMDADLYNYTNKVAYQSGGKAWTNTTTGNDYSVIGITNALPENHSLITTWNAPVIQTTIDFVIANEAYASEGWSAGTLWEKRSCWFWQDGTSIGFVCFNPTGSAFNWNFTSHAWQVAGASYPATVGTTYYFEFRANQTHIFLRLYNSTKGLIEEATRLRSDTRFASNNLYWFYGDVWNNAHYGNSSIDDLIVRKYQTPEPTYSIKEEEEADLVAPTYSLNSTNSTLAGTLIEHRLKWEDNIELSGYIFSFDNCTGSLANDTWQSFSANPDWSNVTKTVNETVGCEIRWCVYANDTSDNWNGTSCDAPFSYVTTAPIIPPEICIQHFLEENTFIILCNVTSISHNQNYCLDNVTLVHNITYTINETVGQYDRLEYCNYGCNNESLKCNPEPFEVNLYIIGGIFAFIILLGIILKIFRVI